MLRRCLLDTASAVKSNSFGAQSAFCRGLASTSTPVECTLFPGDGIGPEIATAVKSIFSNAGVPITWDEQIVGTTADPRTNSMVTRENLDSVLVSVLQQPNLFSALPCCILQIPVMVLMLCRSTE